MDLAESADVADARRLDAVEAEIVHGEVVAAWG
jgi:hypothetical protein